MSRHEVQRRQNDYNAYRSTLDHEDASKRYFDAVCRSIEDPDFANDLLSISSSMNLATFGPNLRLIKCRSVDHPGECNATGPEIERQIYANKTRFYYKIRTGPFASWVIRPTYTSLGLFAGGFTHFTVEKEGSWWDYVC